MEKKRFTERRYPIAAKLIKSEFIGYDLYLDRLTSGYNRDKINPIYSRIAVMVGNVDIVTDPFYTALEAAAHCFEDINFLRSLPEFTLTNSAIISGHYYIYEAYKKDNIVYCVCLAFYGSVCYGYADTMANTDTGQTMRTTNYADGMSTTFNTASSMLSLALFKKYGDIEVNTLPPNVKTELFRCRYLNDLPDNVTLLTCKWFTDLHQNNPFFVRGHFRWQPFGAGLIQRKLIWVDMYSKTGYHALAQKRTASGE